VNKTTAWILLIALGAILLSASFCAPYYLSDDGNTFFKNFATHELLSVLGVIVTITLASAANLHLALNKLQDEIDDDFTEARAAIRLSSHALIAAFVLAGVLVMAKPTAVPTQTVTALFNSGVVLLLVFSVAVLWDLTAAVFDIPPLKDLKARQDEKGK